MADYTATALIASLRRRGWLPAASALTTADCLAILNEEARVYLTALLKSVREEYLVREADYDVPLVAGTARYRMPTRCVANALRSVHVLDGQSNPRPLTRVEPENQHGYPGSGSPVGYMLRGGTLQLLPTPGGGGTLRLGYLQRLSQVVDASACGRVTAINTGTGAVTVSAAPATFVTTASGVPLYDFVRGTPAFESLAVDQSATVAGTILTFATVPAELAVGDYVALAGETPIPQVPLECHALLAQRAVVVLLEATGSPRLEAARRILEGEDGKGGMQADVMRLLSPRVTGSTRPLVNPNGPGMRRRF